MYKYYQSDWDARAQALCAAPMFASPTVPNPNQDEAEQQCQRAEWKQGPAEWRGDLQAASISCPNLYRIASIHTETHTHTPYLFIHMLHENKMYVSFFAALKFPGIMYYNTYQ